MSRTIIITADDYGMCSEINEAIEECLEAGALRATCVMTNMPLYEKAGFLRKRFPNCSIGIHWNMTQGRPVLPASEIPSLLGPDGMFLSKTLFRDRWLKGRINSDEIMAELRAQERRFQEVGGTPDFWNTHNHVHLLPGLFQKCVLVGQELGIPAMRCNRHITVPPNNQSLSLYLMRHPAYWLRGKVIAWWSRQAEAKGMIMPDGMINLIGETNRSALLNGVASINWGSVKKTAEMVIHPATRVNWKLFGSLTEKRILEYKMYRDPGLVRSLQEEGVEPAGFEVLQHTY